MSKKKHRVAQSESPSVLVGQPALLEKCRPILSGLLRDVQGLGFDENPRTGGEIEYLLSGQPVSFAIARGRYPVLPLLRTDNNTFWIGVSLRFVEELRHKRLKNVSLIFFEGLASDFEKRPLLRAEWDDWRGAHAQPHWHVYSMPDARASQVFEGADLPPQAFGVTTSFGGEDLQTSSGKILSLDKFHYAMSSLWHAGGLGSHWCELSEDALLKWLQGCIMYTEGQLRYISE
jgi:hypothetical protein